MIDRQSTAPSSHSEVAGDEGLRSLTGDFPEPEFQDLRRYAELTSRGQAAEALITVQRFIAEASRWDIRPRRQAAVRIAEAAWNSGSGPGSDTLPDPLWNELVEPTLQQWAADDDVALPHRLLALLDGPSLLHLRRAHELDPEDQLIAQRFAAALIRDIHFSAKHLGEIDIAKLEEAEHLVASLQDDEVRQSRTEDLDELRQRVTNQSPSDRRSTGSTR